MRFLAQPKVYIPRSKFHSFQWDLLTGKGYMLAGTLNFLKHFSSQKSPLKKNSREINLIKKKNNASVSQSTYGSKINWIKKMDGLMIAALLPTGPAHEVSGVIYLLVHGIALHRNSSQATGGWVYLIMNNR